MIRNTLINKEITLLCSVIICFSLQSCTSEAKKKERVVQYITRDMCNSLSTTMSQSIEDVGTGNATIDVLAISIINSFDVPIENFCHCFTDIVGKELSAKFTYNELIELRKDKMKQLMVAAKLIEHENIQLEIETCLVGKVQETSKEYEDYQKSLDDKFGK